MTPALVQLAELVRQAEAKTRARKIEVEAQHAGEQFRVAELRARQAVEQLRQARPVRLKALEQADADEQLLKDLVRKLALYKSSLGSEADAERLIATSQAEIERTRQQTRTELAEIGREVEDARRELRTATDHYRQLRRELDRLQPELAAKFLAEDRLLWDAESHFPGGQLQLLGHEVDAGLSAFGTLSKLEQYARLKVWIGRFRSYQASQDREVEATEELLALSHRVFHQLKWLSRQYEPGYIEAFRQDFSADWTAYVAEAQDQLVQAIEASRRARDADPHLPREHELGDMRPVSLVSRSPVREPVVMVAAVASASFSEHPHAACPALTGLKALVAEVRLPDEGLDRFLEALRQAVGDLGTTDPDLLRLVFPYREFIAGDDGLGVFRRNLERFQDDRNDEQAYHGNGNGSSGGSGIGIP
jgi:hypothetical protein